MTKFNLNQILLLLAAMLFTHSCGTSPAEEKTSSTSHLLTVATAPVVRASMVDTVRIFGTVHLRNQAQVGSQFDGRLDDFSLLPGDHVRKGQQIGTIIPPAREALLRTLQNMPAHVRPDLEKQIRAIPLISPIDGIVLEVMHHTGDVVQQGEQIVQIGDLHELDIRGDLPVQYLPSIRQTDQITASFVDYPHPSMNLSLQAISGQINESNQTAMIRLKLENPAETFRPGMLVRLAFAGSRHDSTLIIPRPALLEEEGVYSVFVLKDIHVERRQVEPGFLQDDRVEILSGVAADELVITERAYSLDDGMEVVVRNK